MVLLLGAGLQFVRDDEVVEDLGIFAQKEVEMLKQALQRIADDTFGFRARCGEPIAEDRLNSVPKRLCAQIAQRLPSLCRNSRFLHGFICNMLSVRL